MKTIVLGLFLGLTALTNAQNKIAYVEVNDDFYSSRTSTVLSNTAYLNSFPEDIVSERVKAMQKIVANYEIKESSVYSENSLTQYTVIFTEGKNTIKAVYDSKGNILQCEERFESVAVPYKVSLEILKDYPGWAFDKVWCYINYSGDSPTEVIYKAVLKNGNKKKTVKIDALASL